METNVLSRLNFVSLYSKLINMEIRNVKKGHVNDDFIHNRVTLKVETKNEVYLLKLYDDGRLTSFAGDEYLGDYIEKPASKEMKELLKPFI